MCRASLFAVLLLPVASGCNQKTSDSLLFVLLLFTSSSCLAVILSGLEVSTRLSARRCGAVCFGVLICKLSSSLLTPGVAASMAASFTHPLDLTKVRMQTLNSAAITKSPSIINIIRASVASSGMRSLYTGLSASLLRQMSYSLVRLGSYEEIKRRLSKNGPPSTFYLLLAATFAGGLGGIAGNPADILLVRMTSDLVRPPEKRYGYSNAFSGLVELVKDEGVRGLTRGLGTNMTRAMMMNASQVGSYDYLKSKLLRSQIPVINYQFHDNLLLHVVASCLAGAFATTVCSPADVIRSRLMASSEKATFLGVLKTSLREEGPGFLFKGWTPAFIRLGPNTVLLFVFFEQLKKTWKSSFT